MLRNLGISLLLFGLLAAGIDGFRMRERQHMNPTAPSNGTAATEDELVHTAEFGIVPPR
jgi:hypothetical protein